MAFTTLPLLFVLAAAGPDPAQTRAPPNDTAVSPTVCELYRTGVTSLDKGAYGMSIADADDGSVYLYGGQTEYRVSKNLLVLANGRHAPVRRHTKATPRRYHDALVIGQELVVFGGDTGEDLTAEVIALSLDGKSTRTLAPLPAPRSFVSAARHDGRIYVIGGRDEQGHRNAHVFIYDIRADSWRIGPELAEARDAKLIDIDGTLYAIGGYRGSQQGGPTALVEKLPPAAKKWLPAGTLNQPTSAHAVAAAGHRVVIFGDYTDLGRVQVYDSKSEETVELRQNDVPRRHAAAVAVGDKIFVAGGNRDRTGSFMPLLETFVLRCGLPPLMPQATCLDLARAGLAADDAAQLHTVRERCGLVPHVDNALAAHALNRGNADAALSHVVTALTGAGGNRKTLRLLGALEKRTDTAAIFDLGRSKSAPIYVTSVNDEHRFGARFACRSGKRRHLGQGLGYDGLDTERFTCDGDKTKIIFDFKSSRAFAELWPIYDEAHPAPGAPH